MNKQFQYVKEDFVCKNCGSRIKGGGYTNHCPHCLWSRHVDVNPGDREAICEGMMKPVGFEIKGKEYVIIHRCLKCSSTTKNKAAKNDNFEAILQL